MALNCEPGGRFSMLKSGSWSLSSLALFPWETEETEETAGETICGYLVVIFLSVLLSSHLEQEWLLHSPVIAGLAGHCHAGEALDKMIVMGGGGGGPVRRFSPDVNFGLLYFVGNYWEVSLSLVAEHNTRYNIQTTSSTVLDLTRSQKNVKENLQKGSNYFSFQQNVSLLPHIRHFTMMLTSRIEVMG